MKKYILTALFMLALQAGAQTFQLLQPAYSSCMPVIVGGAAPDVVVQPVVYTQPVAYAQPVVYTAPVQYVNTTVVYNAPVVYANTASVAPVVEPPCFAAGLCGYRQQYCSSVQVIPFGGMQACSQGYHFSAPR